MNARSMTAAMERRVCMIVMRSFAPPGNGGAKDDVTHYFTNTIFLTALNEPLWTRKKYTPLESDDALNCTL